jgi:hypothetical protein
MGFALPGLRSWSPRRLEGPDKADCMPGEAGQGTHDQGFAGPGGDDRRDPCSPLAGFRVRVC